MNARAARVDAFAAPVLYAGWWGVMTLLPIGHLTALRNAWTVVIVVGTLLWAGRAAWGRMPARGTLALLLLWCAASIGWSTAPAISFGKWRTDLLIPVLAYAAAFAYVRRTGTIAPLAKGMVTGLGAVAAMSLVAWTPASLMPAITAWMPLENFTNVAPPLPYWYPGVGDASMEASLATAVLIGAPRMLPHVSSRWWWAGWSFVAIVVLVSNNRNAALAIPIVAFVAWLSLRRRRSGPAPIRSVRARRSRITMGVVAALVVTAAVVAILESGARARLRVIGQPAHDDESALVVLAERDTRPMIWAYYARLAMQSPIVGVGFGRTVPGIHYRTQDDRALTKVEFNAYIHAHNLFLDWWLQTGVIGVGLLGAALVAVARRARCPTSDRAVEAASADGTGGATSVAAAAYVALLALLASMLIRDATDDFMVYGMATMFWALFGGLAGVATMPAGVTARRAP